MALPTAFVYASPEPLSSALKPVAEIEEEVYAFEPANNGAGPMWCSGSTCLVRAGDSVFASGLETIKDAPPLNNCRWTLWHRPLTGWRQVLKDSGRTREPSPVVVFPDDREVLVSANPTLARPDHAGGGPAQPAILAFTTTNLSLEPAQLAPSWSGKPEFTEHSYRSFAADGPRREFILFQNIGETHAEWIFQDGEGRWKATGSLRWPVDTNLAKPHPVRICYPNVALVNRAVHFVGVSDIIEPNPEWRAYKKELTGREWDYDFRRLFYTRSGNILTNGFADWIEVASRERTCGWITPGDLWVAPDGAVHIVWTERAIDERLRKKFFADARQRWELNYAIVRDGVVGSRRTLAARDEGESGPVPNLARFQVTPDHRLFVVAYFSGTDADGKSISDNRVAEVVAGEAPLLWKRVPLKRPFNSFFTATPRAGSAPSRILDLLGTHPDSPQTISYARVRLF